MPGTFTRKKIEVTFQLGQGQFGTSGFNTVAISSVSGTPGPRIQCDIAQAGGIAKGQMNLRVFGLPLKLMNALARVGRTLNLGQQQNLVSVSAGDSETGMAVIYQGSIFSCWADFSSQPESPLWVEAMAGWWESLAKFTPTSYKGPTSAQVILQNSAAANGKGYQNYGVTSVLDSPYFAGSAWNQFAMLLKACNCYGTLDPISDQWVIWPKNGSRSGQIPVIGPRTTAVGYPRYNTTGITLKSLFNPSIILGGNIQVESQLTGAAGVWTVNNMTHNLESQREGGAWFSTMECSSPGNLVLQSGGK
jgi:hypothetical protein